MKWKISRITKYFVYFWFFFHKQNRKNSTSWVLHCIHWTPKLWQIYTSKYTLGENCRNWNANPYVRCDIFAIDFPGSDSLADQICARVESSGHMNNLQIYVMMYNGSPNQQLISNVKMAYRLKKLSGKSSINSFVSTKLLPWHLTTAQFFMMIIVKSMSKKFGSI